MDQDVEGLIEILESQDEALVAMAKALLEGAGIESAVNNEFSHNILPGFSRGMQIWVRPEDVEAARAILAPLMESEGAPSAVASSDSRDLSGRDEPADDQPVASNDLSYAAPKPEQPFSIRLLIVAAILLIPIILAIIYSLQKQPAH